MLDLDENLLIELKNVSNIDYSTFLSTDDVIYLNGGSIDIVVPATPILKFYDTPDKEIMIYKMFTYETPTST